MDCADDGAEGRRRGMGVVPIVCGAGINRDSADEGEHMEAAGKIAYYVSGRLIYKLCTGAERMQGSSRLLQ